jgi:hypothetical protein
MAPTIEAFRRRSGIPRPFSFSENTIMDETVIKAVFKPRPSRQETKADMTTRIAREILDIEASARIEKSERLRAARMAREALAAPAPARKKPRRKK